MCRYHTQYPSDGPYSHLDSATAWAARLDDEEQEMWDDEWDDFEQGLSEAILDCEETRETFRSKVETLKADEMFMSAMLTPHCGDCHPLIDMYADREYCHACDCDGAYGHFVSRFRCIPCVLQEEAKLVALQRKGYTVEYGYIREGKYHYRGVSNPMPFSRSLLTNRPDHLLRLREAGIEHARL
jgi:hypothetical protein